MENDTHGETEPAQRLVEHRMHLRHPAGLPSSASANRPDQSADRRGPEEVGTTDGARTTVVGTREQLTSSAVVRESKDFLRRAAAAIARHNERDFSYRDLQRQLVLAERERILEHRRISDMYLKEQRSHEATCRQLSQLQERMQEARENASDELLREREMHDHTRQLLRDAEDSLRVWKGAAIQKGKQMQQSVDMSGKNKLAEALAQQEELAMDVKQSWKTVVCMMCVTRLEACVDSRRCPMCRAHHDLLRRPNTGSNK
jgi:rubrerythrin